MRNVTWLLLLSSLALTAPAQGVFSNQTNAALQKVIADYPNHFSNIKGDRLSQSAKVVDYKSKVQVPGSITCTLTQYGSSNNAYSWKCDLYQTNDFDQAKARFSELFNQIHNTIIKVEGEKPFILNGKYEVPRDKNPASVTFHLLPASTMMQKLKVELNLQHDPAGWKVVLNVYEQEGSGDFASEQ